jgi:hypothetical protein
LPCDPTKSEKQPHAKYLSIADVKSYGFYEAIDASGKTPAEWHHRNKSVGPRGEIRCGFFHLRRRMFVPTIEKKPLPPIGSGFVTINPADKEDITSRARDVIDHYMSGKGSWWDEGRENLPSRPSMTSTDLWTAL